MSLRSLLESFHVWTQASSDVLELYSEFAVMKPVIAKSATSGPGSREPQRPKGPKGSVQELLTYWETFWHKSWRGSN